MLEIKIRQNSNIIILDLSGRVDANSAKLVEIVGQCLREGYADILCNLEEVESIDYIGISVLVIAYKEVVNNRGRMKFMNIPIHLRGVFTVSGMDRAIEIYATEESALNSFKEDKVIEGIKKMQLRRRFKRLPIDLKIELKSKTSGQPSCLKVDILNLSAVGAFIFGCDKFKLGDELILNMKLAPREEELVLDASVVWIPDKEVQPHEYPGIGVEFRNLSAETQQKLIDFIERNLSFMSSD
ncbi:MAG: anti-sigma factor antagonist [Candidatus Omnitrophica bacterium]|nr:anti-sigma factor antagonist [Candidatus Omnitrophota bacterium]